MNSETTIIRSATLRMNSNAGSTVSIVIPDAKAVDSSTSTAISTLSTAAIALGGKYSSFKDAYHDTTNRVTYSN